MALKLENLRIKPQLASNEINRRPANPFKPKTIFFNRLRRKV